MKDNNYAYGKCFTCAKKFTPTPDAIAEDIIEGLNTGMNFLGMVALHCAEHLKSARRRRFCDRWCQRFFTEGRIEEIKLLRWAQTLKGADIQGSSQNITINIHNSIDADIWEDRGDEIVKLINESSESNVKIDISKKEKEDDHVDVD